MNWFFSFLMASQKQLQCVHVELIREKRKKLGPLTCNLHETCFNWLHVKICLLYLKFGVMDAPQGSFTENAIHWEQHTFCIFAFLAHPVLAYRKFNTGSFNKWSTPRERSIVLHLSLRVLWPFPLSRILLACCMAESSHPQKLALQFGMICRLPLV